MEVVFLIVTFLSFLLFYLGTSSNKQVLYLSASWIVVIGLLAYSGFFEVVDTTPPRFAIVLLGGTALVIYLYKKVSSKKININLLLGLHLLRIPIELVLFQLYNLGQVPELMTFHGYNYDILIGISALAILLLSIIIRKKLSRSFLLFWNWAGMVFLTAIVVMAILSSPLQFQQLAFEQPNVAVLKFPYVYLPAYIVPMVCLSHLLTIKSLVQEK